MIRRPPRSTQSRSSAASDVYKRQPLRRDVRREALEVGPARVEAVDLGLFLPERCQQGDELRRVAGMRGMFALLAKGVAGRLRRLDALFHPVELPLFVEADPALPRRDLCGGAARGSGALLLLSLIHISEPTRLGMISYAVFCLKKKKNN